MKCTILVDILLLIGVVYLFSMCSSDNKCNNTTNAPYELNHYIDTVNGHVILTTVCFQTNKYYLGVNTLELK